MFVNLDKFINLVSPCFKRYILDNKSLFAGKNVLEIGCGCGASSIAARLAGANRVTANDIDESEHKLAAVLIELLSDFSLFALAALQATLLNAELNAVTAGLEVINRNQIGQPCDDVDYDVLLIGDLFYDAEIADVLMPWLTRLAASRKSVSDRAVPTDERVDFCMGFAILLDLHW